MKIIGIDPGLAATGIGVVTGCGFHIESFSYGTIRTNKDSPIPVRLNLIFDQISKVIIDERPALLMVEDVFSLGKYPKASIMLGKVSGVILLAGIRSEIPVAEIQVKEVKQVLTGNGNAAKAQLQEAVRHFLKAPIPITPDHASDALGLALVGLLRCERAAHPLSAK